MTLQQKIKELKSKIVNELSPLINNDYLLLDLPYYSNIGDSLIWEGEEAFLNTLDYRCLYRASADTYIEQQITPETIILLQGGGNFGDIYKKHQNFRKEIIHRYPENKIIIFPVSVNYSDQNNIYIDVDVFSKHKDLTICTRDKNSYNILSDNFDNNILLLPDMAFCINPADLLKNATYSSAKTLLLKRDDKELALDYDYKKYIIQKEEVDILDWPSKQKNNWKHKIINRPIHPRTPFKSFSNSYAHHIYKPYLLKIGVKFLSNYNYIYTTRLHGAILSVLLDKPFTFFDNSYGKNIGFYEAWLSDVEGIKFIKF